MIHDEKKTVFVRPNIFWHRERVSLVQLEAQNNQGSAVLWFTGLSGAGKSTVAHAVEEYLHQQGLRTIVLDGDKVNFPITETDKKEVWRKRLKYLVLSRYADMIEEREKNKLKSKTISIDSAATKNYFCY